MSTATKPLQQQPSPDAREVALAVINRVLPTYARGMHAADDATLAHEAERLESQHKSPVVRSMQAIVDAERLDRRRQAAAR